VPHQFAVIGCRSERLADGVGAGDELTRCGEDLRVLRSVRAERAPGAESSSGLGELIVGGANVFQRSARTTRCCAPTSRAPIRWPSSALRAGSPPTSPATSSTCAADFPSSAAGARPRPSSPRSRSADR
jgi:hypothetical protein